MKAILTTIIAMLGIIFFLYGCNSDEKQEKKVSGNKSDDKKVSETKESDPNMELTKEKCGRCHGWKRGYSEGFSKDSWKKIIHNMAGKKSGWISGEEEGKIFTYISNHAKIGDKKLD